MATGIKDKVAILGMGCSRFGERWESGAEELMVEAFTEAIADTGIDVSEIDAAWFSTHYEEINVGKGGLPLSVALRLPNIAVTPGGELLRIGLRSLSRRCLCGGLRRLRHRPRPRRGETQGTPATAACLAGWAAPWRRSGQPTPPHPAASPSWPAPTAPSTGSSGMT